MNIWEEISDWDYSRLEDLMDYVNDAQFKTVAEVIDTYGNCEFSTIRDFKNKIVYFVLNDDDEPYKLLELKFDDNDEVSSVDIVDETEHIRELLKE